MKKILRNTISVLAMSVCIMAQADDKGRLYVIGDATPGRRDLDKAQALLATPGDDALFTGTLYLTADQNFKFMESHDWGGTEYGMPEGAPTPVSGEFTLATGSLDNGYGQIKVAVTGNYYISVNTATLKADIHLSDYQTTPVERTSLFLVGGATPGGWSVEDGTPLYQSVEMPCEYSAEVPLKNGGESFKIAKSLRGACSFDSKYFYFRDGADDGKISDDGDGDRQWSVADADKYNVTVNTVNNTIAIKKPGQSGVDVIIADTETEAVYYNLQGQRADNPVKGVYIKVSGNKAEKVVL